MVSCYKRVCLFMWLHFEISSVLLLRMSFPLNNAISGFSFRHRLHLSDDRLKYEHFLRIFHFIWGTEFLRFIFQSLFKSSVSFLYADKLKDLLWLLYLCGLCYTYINFLTVGSFIACDGGFVYNLFNLTVSVLWTKLFPYAVALSFVWTWSILM